MDPLIVAGYLGLAAGWVFTQWWSYATAMRAKEAADAAPQRVCNYLATAPDPAVEAAAARLGRAMKNDDWQMMADAIAERAEKKLDARLVSLTEKFDARMQTLGASVSSSMRKWQSEQLGEVVEAVKEDARQMGAVDAFNETATMLAAGGYNRTAAVVKAGPHLISIADQLVGVVERLRQR